MSNNKPSAEAFKTQLLDQLCTNKIQIRILESLYFNYDPN